MLRKFAIGLFASAAIAAAALSPTSASAHPLGWGWGLGFGYHGYLAGPTVVMAAPETCTQRTPVQTRHGIRFRTVNVCTF
jgi:hypothetical protein